jgi:putative ABC transport system permease protein
MDPWILAQAVVLAILAALLAGIYPIWRMARTHPAEALRAE